MFFAHVVPKKGFSHEHGAAELIKDIAKLGYNEIILKFGELASWRQSGERSSRASRAGNRRASAGDSPRIGAKT